MFMNLFHCLGSSAILVLIAFIITDSLDNKKLTKQVMISRIVVVSILMFILIRT